MIALYAPLVWHWCRKMGLPGQEIADVFQEVFKAVAAHIGKFQKDRAGGTFRGWLRRITTNKIHDYYRRQQHEPEATGGTDARIWFSQVPEGAAADDGADDQQIYTQLFYRALELIQTEFEERTWRAFWRVVVDSQDTHEVAKELAMSPGAVRVAKCRVLHRLRQELGDLPL